MISLGIDPGLSGAISAICSRRGLLDVEDLPVCSNGMEKAKVCNWIDVAGLAELLTGWSLRFDFGNEAVIAFLERAIPMPEQTVWTAASCFDSVGALRAVMTLRRYELRMITPVTWKRYYRLGKNKDEARQTAIRLYPDASLVLARKRDHNRAEALLIARYGLRSVE